MRRTRPTNGLDQTTRRRWPPVRVTGSALVVLALLAAGCGSKGAPGRVGSSAPGRVDSTANGTSAVSSTTQRGETAAWSLVVEPNDGLLPLYNLMSGARRSLDMTMYELADPGTVDILERDAARGVQVRVLLDREYSGASVNAADYAQLAGHGVEVRWAYSGTIFHQKSVTVDDARTAIMTLNLTSQYYPTTRDFAVITDDVGDVSAVETTFDRDWSASGPPDPGPSGDGLVWSPGSTDEVVHLIDSARHSLLIENEEMDDPAVEAALESSALRGVNVEVVMSYSSQWAPAFARLAAAGVHLRTYAPEASLYIHAKVIVADSATVFVGSQNFSDSSLDDNRELGIVTRSPTVVAGVARAVMSDYAGGTPFAGSTNPPNASPSAAPGSSASSSAGRAFCSATAAAADDGYSGDYDVRITSNQPDAKATASDSTDSWSDYTDGAGSVVIRLYDTDPGESINVTVKSASCAARA